MNKVENENLINLVKDTQNGVDGAFEKLYDATIKFSYNIASFLLKNNEDIEDALQNSYMYVAKYIKDLKNPESFENWLAVIVKHECQKYIATRKRVSDIFAAAVNSEELELTDDSDLPDDVFDSEERRSAVRAIVDNLPYDKRACVVLYYFEQHSLPEIAEILGIPEGTVKSRLFKARKMLEKEFEKLRKKDDTFYGFSIIPLIVGLFAWQAKNVAVPVSVAKGATACLAAAETAVIADTFAAMAASGTTAVTTGTTSGVVGGVAATVTTKVVAVTVAATVVTGGSVATVNYVKNRNKPETTFRTTLSDIEEYTTAAESALTEIAVIPTETSSVSQITDDTDLTASKEESTASASVSHSVNTVTSTTKPVTTRLAVTTSRPSTTTTRPATTATTGPTTTTRPRATTTRPVTTTTRPVTTTRVTTTAAQPTTNAADVFSVSNGVISEYKGNSGNVSVPSSIGSENITAIGTGAFEGNAGITSVSLPSTVTRIGQSAFADCTNLRSISLPDSLKNIGIGAFCNCTSLVSVSIPSGVTAIGDDAFADCSSLSAVTIPLSVTSIGDNAFGGCNNLTIKCTEGSAAHDYAVENSINFELI